MQFKINDEIILNNTFGNDYDNLKYYTIYTIKDVNWRFVGLKEIDGSYAAYRFMPAFPTMFSHKLEQLVTDEKEEIKTT